MKARQQSISRRSGRRFLALGAAALAVLLLMPGPSAAKKKKDITRPVTADDQLQFGVDMAKRGLWKEALFRFQRAHQLDPSQPRVLNNMAVAFEAVGQFDLALEYYKKALEVDPANRDLRRNYARFVEFYQSFRPPEEAEASAEGDDESEEGAPAETDGA